MSAQIKSIKRTIPELRVAVVGDAMLDVYIDGRSSRVSREAPVPIVEVEREERVPGGAANVAVNCATLGAAVDFFGVVGDDLEGAQLREALEGYGIGIRGLGVDPELVTLAKKRVRVGAHQLVRFDLGTPLALGKKQEHRLSEALGEGWREEEYDAVIISDYGYGTITEAVLDNIRRSQQRIPTVLAGDGKDLQRMRKLGVTVVKPNYAEACHELGIREVVGDRERVRQMGQAGRKLLDRVKAEVVAVTMDSAGAWVFGRKGRPYRTYTNAQPASNTVGAGDTYISAFTLALATETTVPAAAEFAAAACELVVQKPGTVPCYREELFVQDPYSGKRVINRRSLEQLVRKYRQEEKTVVFTNGCFDILHRGHVSYLNQAKELGDVLIVGVNTDETIKRLKGEARPINNLDDRLHVLSALSSVDHLTPFGELTPIKLIELIQPDVFVKGGDYTRESLPETKVVERYGGEVKILDYIKKYSTTELISRIHANGISSRSGNGLSAKTTLHHYQ